MKVIAQCLLILLIFLVAYRNTLANDYANLYEDYQQLLRTGYSGAELYYNLGIIDLESNNLGQALYYLNKAKSHSPRDIEIGIALAQTRSRADLNITGTDHPLYWVEAFHHQILSRVELGYLALSFWGIFFIAFALSRTKQAKLWIRPVLPFLLVLTIIMIGLFGASLWIERAYPKLIVMESTPIMSGPGSDYLQLSSIETGEGFLIDKYESWGRVLFSDGSQGWLSDQAYNLLHSTPLISSP